MNPKSNEKAETQHRGDSVFIGFWVPTNMADAADRAARRLDLDRSKLLRRALAEKISKEEAR